MKRLVLLSCLLVWANVQAGELYRSIDSSGKVHYSDRPLQGSEDVQELKLGAEPPPDESLPYETQRAKDNFPVTFYTFPDCGSVCSEARDLMNKRGIPFSEKSLVTNDDVDAFVKESGDRQMPALKIGKTWHKGFLAEQWNKEFDYAGYPKTPPYRPRPATPPTKPAQ